MWRDRDGGKGRREGKRSHKVLCKFWGSYSFIYVYYDSFTMGKTGYSFLSFLLGTKDKVFSVSKFRNECKSAACCKSFPRQVHGYK